MKQFLFATTALVATAGVAMADVEISGSAEMGIVSVDVDDDIDVVRDDADRDGDVEFHTDIDLTFTLSGATDGGLIYGASIDLDESNDNDAFEARTQGGESIFISGGFGTLTMGDTDGALDWAMTETDTNATSINDDQEHAGWSGNAGLDGQFDGQVLRYDYTVGDFAFAVSGEIDDEGDSDDDPTLGVGVRGSFDFGGSSIGFGLGYQEGDDSDGYGVSLNTTVIETFTVVLNYSNINRNDARFETVLGDDPDTADTETDFILIDALDDDFEHYGIGVGYNQGPLSLHGNYGVKDFDDGDEAEGFGLTAGYELGDDVELQAGYGYSDIDDGDDDSGEINTFSFGLSMSF